MELTDDITVAEETPMANILGLPVKATLNGVDYMVEPLDFNDVATMETHIGRMEYFDWTSSTHQRLAVWLALRKIDPTLTAEQKRNCEYNMTLEDAGRMLPISVDKIAERKKFVMDVLFMSGLCFPVNPDEENQGDEGKKPDPPLNRAQRRVRK